jgi:hypothetical protein
MVGCVFGETMGSIVVGRMSVAWDQSACLEWMILAICRGIRALLSLLQDSAETSKQCSFVCELIIRPVRSTRIESRLQSFANRLT